MTLRSVKLQRDPLNSAPVVRPTDLWRPLENSTPAGNAKPEKSSNPVTPLLGSLGEEAARTEKLQNALDVLTQATNEIHRQIGEMEAHYLRKCAGTVAQIISAAAPAICEAAAQAAIARVLDEAAGSSAIAEVSIKVAPDLYETLREACEQRALPMSLHSDEGLAPGALQVRWREGGLDCDLGRSLFAIVDFLNSQLKLTNEEDAL